MFVRHFCRPFRLWGAAAVLAITLHAGSITTFSGSGFTTPETITPIPAGFGSVGGEYFVPDATGELYVLPTGGGSPTLFANLDGAGVISGVFVPSGYGSLTGQFLVTGNDNALAVNSSGVVTNVGFGGSIWGDVVAPPGFGSVGGEVLLGNDYSGTSDILSLNSNGSTTVFATLAVGNSSTVPEPGALGFAPSDFGPFGGDLLVTDEISGNIYAVDSSGNVTLFATLPVPTLSGGATAGVRQFAFAPSGYGPYGGDMFVSVSGSQTGGGVSGSVDVLNDTGQIIAVLLEGTVGAPFDPRGLYFTSSDQLLIADTDPGILSATPAAFTAVPEPSGLMLIGIGALALVGSKMKTML